MRSLRPEFVGLVSVLSASVAIAAGAGWIIPGYGKRPIDAVEAFGARTAEHPVHGRALEDVWIARSCADLERGFSMPAANDREARESRSVKRECEALRMLMSAQEPKQSQLSGWELTEKSFAELPDCFVPMFRDEEPVDAVGKSWKASAPKAEVAKLPNGLRVVDSGEVAYSTFLQLLGRADFNDDGFEDVLLSTDWQLTGGTLGSGALVILTKKPGDKVLRVVRDGEGRCKPSVPEAVPCSEKAVARARAEFQRRYDAKEYASAYEFLDAFLAACGGEAKGLSGNWMRNDLALTAHHLGRDAHGLDLLLSAGLQSNDSPEDDRLIKAVEANRALCTKSLRCTAKQIAAARNEFSKTLAKKDPQSALARLDSFVKGCEGSGDANALAWAYSDLALTASKVGDTTGCSAYLDLADRLPLGEGEGDGDAKVLGAIATNRKRCPRPEPIPVSTPITAAPWTGTKTPATGGSIKLTWVGHCEGDLATAKLVSREEAPTTKGPFCVKFDVAAFDPNGFNDAEVEGPKWDSMRSAMLLIETPDASPVTVTLGGEERIPKCEECESSCLAVKSKKKLGATASATPVGGRYLFDATASVKDWRLASLLLDASVSQGSTTAKASLELSQWARCM